jgi:hypothetical protein
MWTLTQESLAEDTWRRDRENDVEPEVDFMNQFQPYICS